MVSGDGDSFWDEEAAATVEPDLGVDDFPDNPLVGILYGFQHTLVDPNPFIYPFIIGTAAGWSNSTIGNVVQATLIFAMITTVSQTTIGNRLPLLQNVSISEVGVMASIASTIGVPAMWMAAFLGGVFEFFVGFSKVLKYLRFAITPAVSGTVIVVIGVSLAELGMSWIFNGSDIHSVNLRLLFAGVTIATFLLLRIVGELKMKVLSRASLMLTLLFIGLFAPWLTDRIGLTEALNFRPVLDAPWFGLPQLTYEGLPVLDWPLVLGAIGAMMIGYMSSIMESIGDYAAVCSVSDAEFTEEKIHRGISVEGGASALSVLFGGLPMTSYSQNIGIIATTRVASRKVVIIAGLFFGLYGLLPKVGQLITVIPEAVLGGVFLIITGMIAVSGIWTIARAERTEANMLTIALTLVISLTFPNAITGTDWVNSLPANASVFLTSSIVLSVISGVVFSSLFTQITGSFTQES